MSLLTVRVFKKQSYSSRNLLDFSKTRPKAILKSFQYQILTSVKRSEKQLGSKVNFSTFFQLSYLKVKTV